MESHFAGIYLFLTQPGPFIPLRFITRLRLFIIFSLPCLLGAAQEHQLVFDRYAHADGLSNNWVFSILQDQRGFLWVGTWDGLNQFDGKDFRVFQHGDAGPSSPSGKEIRCLSEDEEGKIWMGTEQGLCHLDPQTGMFTAVQPSTELRERWSFDDIFALCVDTVTGRVWAGGNGLFTAATNENILSRAPGTINERLFFTGNHTINHILKAGKRLWLASSQGILAYDTESGGWKEFRYAGHKEYLPGIKHINRLYIDDAGILWAATWGAGLLKADTARMEILDYFLPQPEFTDASHNILNGIIKSPGPDDENILWISGVTGGLMKFDPASGAFHVFGTEDPQEPGSVFQEGYAVYATAATGLWAGTRLGLYHLDFSRQFFREYKPIINNKSGNPKNVYFSLIKAGPADASGATLWLGTNNNGLHEFNRKTGTARPLNPRFGALLPPEVYVSDILHDSDGSHWVATLVNGLIYSDPSGKSTGQIIFGAHDGREVRWINEIADDPSGLGQVLAGTAAGLFVVKKSGKPTRPIAIRHGAEDFTASSVYALNFSRDGSLWFLGYDGVRKAEFIARLNPGDTLSRVVSGPFAEDAPGFIHMSGMILDPDEVLYIAAHKGLFRMDPGRGMTVPEHFRHNGQPVHARVEQLQADLDGNTWVLTSNDLFMIERSSKQLIRVNFEALQESSRMSMGLNPSTGDILLGAWNRIYVVRNDTGLIAREPLPCYITSVTSGKPEPGNQALDFTWKKTELPFEQNNISVSFTTINFRSGAPNLYAYMMTGFDRDWNFTGLETVNYKLPPGKYQFRLKAANAGGIWNEQYVFTDIVIRPPYYRTWWFISLIGLLAASIVYSIYRYRISQLVRLQKMRDHISRDLHDDIGSSLTNIAIMNELAVQETRKGGDTEKILLKSAEDIHEIISSLSDIVWNVNPEYDDLKFLLARMRRYALDLLDNTAISLSLDIAEPEEKTSMNMEQRRDLYMVFKEGLNNLVKYSGAGKAEISIIVEMGSVRMTISDDGKGFEPGSVEFGNGLKNMRQRTEAWKGTFRVDSAPGKGTKLHFIIPIKN